MIPTAPLIITLVVLFSLPIAYFFYGGYLDQTACMEAGDECRFECEKAHKEKTEKVEGSQKYTMTAQ